MSEETLRKNDEIRSPQSIFSDEPETSGLNTVLLDDVLPINASSAEKKCIFAESDSIFSGRFDPSKVCSVLMSLEECDLRELRETLHSALCSAVPAVAGRPLSRRVAGNVSALAEDCWALGYSTAQRLLTQRADSNTLKPAGREPLPPPGPIRPSAPACSSPDASASMEAVIAIQLRLEREVAELRRGKVDIEGRLKTLEGESFKLREECAERDSRITQLVTVVEDMLAGVAIPAPQQAAVVSGTTAAPHEATEAQSSITNGVGSEVTDPQKSRAPHHDCDVAAKIAEHMDLRALGGAIACALKWCVGESDDDGESELPVRPSGPRRGRRGSVALPGDGPSARRGAADSDVGSCCETGPGEPVEQRHVLTGSGAASSLVADVPSHTEARRRKYVIEGFRNDASDEDVRDLVSSVVANLYAFCPLPRRDSMPYKAYMIEVNVTDEACVMNPSHWPVGLTVHFKPTTRQRRKDFRGSPRYNNRASGSAGGRDEASAPRGGRGTAAPQSIQAPGDVGGRYEQQSHWNQQSTEPSGGPTTGYTQGHGDWQVAINRRRRRGQRYTGDGAGRSQQNVWNRKPDARRWPQSDAGRQPQSDAGRWPQSDGGRQPQSDGGRQPQSDGGSWPQPNNRHL